MSCAAIESSPLRLARLSRAFALFCTLTAVNTPASTLTSTAQSMQRISTPGVVRASERSSPTRPAGSCRGRDNTVGAVMAQPPRWW
jgi:hypothetical protein